jgi:hypothetical protein
MALSNRFVSVSSSILELLPRPVRRVRGLGGSFIPASTMATSADWTLPTIKAAWREAEAVWSKVTASPSTLWEATGAQIVQIVGLLGSSVQCDSSSPQVRTFWTERDITHRERSNVVAQVGENVEARL